MRGYDDWKAREPEYGEVYAVGYFPTRRAAEDFADEFLADKRVVEIACFGPLWRVWVGRE